MNLPFTAQEFLEVFGRYNLAVWPAQLALYAAQSKSAASNSRFSRGRSCSRALLTIQAAIA